MHIQQMNAERQAKKQKTGQKEEQQRQAENFERLHKEISSEEYGSGKHIRRAGKVALVLLALSYFRPLAERNEFNAQSRRKAFEDVGGTQGGFVGRLVVLTHQRHSSST